MASGDFYRAPINQNNAGRLLEEIYIDVEKNVAHHLGRIYAAQCVCWVADHFLYHASHERLYIVDEFSM